MKELVEVFAKPLSIICKQFWLTGEVTVDWRLPDVTPAYKKDRKKDPGNYRLISLTLVRGKVMDQTITLHICHNLVIRSSQHGFMKAGPA